VGTPRFRSCLPIPSSPWSVLRPQVQM